MFSDSIGYLVKKRRKEIGMSQTKLAQLAGTSQGYIADLENGKINPTVGTIAKIATVLNLSNDNLLAEAGVINTDINPDIAEIVKASEKMTPSQRKKMLDVTKALFPELFK